MASDSPDGSLERWLSFGANFVAPATLFSGLLFYFGYVSARAQFDYFGVDVDTIGLSTRDYVMRSPQPLLVPLLVLSLLGIGVARLHVALQRRLSALTASSPDPNVASLRAHRQLQRARWLGAAVLIAGIVLLLSYPWAGDWTLFALVTPLLLASGAAVTAYAGRLAPTVAAPAATAVAAVPTGVPTAAAPAPTRFRPGQALVVVAIVANIFWATATVAQWTGRGLAHQQARELDRLPSVILDTQERLFLRDPGVEETVLPAATGQRLHYRYRHLRLLIQGNDRMFLVPDTWSASDSTLVVTLDASVRVQFQFQNQAP